MLQNDLHSPFTPREIHDLLEVVLVVKNKDKKGYH
jgi:hypothetical protein